MSQNSPERERILSEQRAIAAYLIEHPQDRGARLGLSDWLAEELLLDDEER